MTREGREWWGGGVLGKAAWSAFLDKSHLWLRGWETEGVESAAPRRRTQQARSIHLQVEPTGPVPHALPQMRRQGAVWVGVCMQKSALRGSCRMRRRPGLTRGALGWPCKQPGGALSAGRGRWAGHPRAPEASTHADWVASPLQASTWRYLGISGTTVWLPFSLSSLKKKKEL